MFVDERFQLQSNEASYIHHYVVELHYNLRLIPVFNWNQPQIVVQFHHIVLRLKAVEAGVKAD